MNNESASVGQIPGAGAFSLFIVPPYRIKYIIRKVFYYGNVQNYGLQGLQSL